MNKPTQEMINRAHLWVVTMSRCGDSEWSRSIESIEAILNDYERLRAQEERLLNLKDAWMLSSSIKVADCAQLLEEVIGWRDLKVLEARLAEAWDEGAFDYRKMGDEAENPYRDPKDVE